jgi:peptidoglycan/xylan/chitin deacetylase (PgdA/CDA1 family)
MHIGKYSFTALLILVIQFSASASHPAGGYGQVSVKKWADDRKSAFTFTFDDGYITHYQYVKPILDSFGFRGTFFVISGSMTDDLPGVWRYGTWKQFREMALEGHEIGSHTVRHLYLTTLATGDTLTAGSLLYELNQSKNTIEQRISRQCISIAYPYFAYNSNVKTATALFYEGGRGGSTVPINASLVDSQFYAIGGKEEQFDTPRNSTEDDLDELAAFKSYEDSAVSLGKWGMLVAHEVYPFAQITDSLLQTAWYPMSTEWLTSLCQWLKGRTDNNEIWVETMGNVTRYMKERERFQYNIVSQTAVQIKINANDNLNDLIYNYPLTVDITVPADWEGALVSQGLRADTLVTFTSGAITYVRAKVIPDGGILVLDKSSKPTGIGGGSVAFAPRVYSLEQNYPNPFNPVTRIRYSIPVESNVRLTVYNAVGETVIDLARGVQEAGVYEVTFSSEMHSSGVYFYSIIANSTDGKLTFTKTAKMLLMK